MQKDESAKTSVDATTQLPVLRSPMVSSDGELFAYELLFHRDEMDDVSEAALMQSLLSTITGGILAKLVRNNRAFIRVSRDVLIEHADILIRQPRLSIIVDPTVINDAELLKKLEHISRSNCALLLDLCELDATVDEPYGNLGPVLSIARYVRLDAGSLDSATLALRSKELHDRGLEVIAGFVDDHQIYEQCRTLPLKAVQGRYLLLPEHIEMPVLTANRMSILRLMQALQDSSLGPVELGELIRDDVVLSYKLLSCVNSAYFALPRQLKSIQQAAIFFGVARMRNWIYTMALLDSSDRPPELLRAALIRAHMCEKLAKGMPAGYQEMAFMTGLLSLLDTLMRAPMKYLLDHLPLADEIQSALIENQGPFAPLLERIYIWEAGELAAADPMPHDIENMSAIYLEAAHWADQVYSSANSSAQ